MILHLDSVNNVETLSCDVCIIGAGAAGLTIAREFIGTRIDVLLLESGGFANDDLVEQLNDGEVSGAPFVGLRSGRRRGFGGTTSAWGGQCCELDVGDFQARPWVPSSGWPIMYKDIEPYYRRAELHLGVRGAHYDETNWERFGISPVRLESAQVRTTFSVFSPRPRLGKVLRSLLSRSPNIRVLLGATATNVGTTENASVARYVDVRSIAGRRAQINARMIVLCTGTVEAARLLLVSRDTAPNGLGNNQDLVGRYFQDHPTSDTATIVPTNAVHLQDLYGVLYRGRTWYWPKIALALERQRLDRVLNASAFITFQYASSAIEVLREMVKTNKTGGSYRFSVANLTKLALGAPSVFDAGYRRYVLGRSPRAKPSHIDLTCSIEQAPNPNSRVKLADSTDQLGVRRALIDWRLTDRELRTFRVITSAISDEFRRLRLGTVTPKVWLASSDISSWKFWDNYHQTGTTRMSREPADGVVDQNCRVHGVQGLYVAGAPTFPTSGYANPVLTIVALSIRLSDHLKTKLLAAR